MGGLLATLDVRSCVITGAEHRTPPPVSTTFHMRGCQSYGPFLGTRILGAVKKGP